MNEQVASTIWHGFQLYGWAEEELERHRTTLVESTLWHLPTDATSDSCVSTITNPPGITCSAVDSLLDQGNLLYQTEPGSTNALLYHIEPQPTHVPSYQLGSGTTNAVPYQLEPGTTNGLPYMTEPSLSQFHWESRGIVLYPSPESLASGPSEHGWGSNDNGLFTWGNAMSIVPSGEMPPSGLDSAENGSFGYLATQQV